MKKIDSLIGIFGALFIVIAYFLMSFNYITSKSIEYNILNLIGGICLAYRVYLDRNYSNFILEIIFIIIAIKSLIL
jgi:hypothetical protein